MCFRLRSNWQWENAYYDGRTFITGKNTYDISVDVIVTYSVLRV